VDKQGPGGCWIWIAVKNRGGYGFVSRGAKGDGNIYAHRLAYEVLVGPIPAGLQVDHLCRIPSCVNPAHMELVSRRENILRSDGLTARNSRKVVCIRGHHFTNKRASGARRCIECERIARAKERATKCQP